MQKLKSRQLTVLPLIATTYFCVSGGPFGLEDVVAKSGYRGAILILLITPLIWSVPTALMASELATTIPEDGGYYVWVRRAMGRFWGFQEGWLSLIGSIFDMAIYPTLFVQYLAHFAPAATAGSRAFWIGIGLVAASAIWNLLGARAVGGSSVWMVLLLLAPFLALSGYAAAHPSAAGAPQVPLRNADLLGGMLVAMWNYMGFDYSSTIAGEVLRPRRTYPVALAGAVTLVALNYLIPIGAVAANGLDPNRWSTGGWADVARAILPAGSAAAIAAAITLAGMLTALGTQNAQVLTYSRLPPAMAEDGFLPRVFAKHSLRTGVPWVSVLIYSVACALALGLSFTKLILLDVLLTGLSLLLEFAALVALRIREPDLPRPYRVPGGLAGAVSLGICPTALLILTILRNQIEPVGPINALELALILIAMGVLTYFAAKFFGNR